MASLGPSDLAIAVITGGASALLVAPRVGVTLAEKISLTQFLLAAGADIAELNTVRRATSLVKAGGLARACTAGRLVVFILSDVIGDRLDVIASGPCMPIVAQPEEALAILKKYGAIEAGVQRESYHRRKQPDSCRQRCRSRPAPWLPNGGPYYRAGRLFFTAGISRGSRPSACRRGSSAASSRAYRRTASCAHRRRRAYGAGSIGSW